MGGVSKHLNHTQSHTKDIWAQYAIGIPGRTLTYAQKWLNFMEVQVTT